MYTIQVAYIYIYIYICIMQGWEKLTHQIKSFKSTLKSQHDLTNLSHELT